MKTVTTTTVFPKGYPAEKAAERIASAGFDALDMGLDYFVCGADSPFLGNGYPEWADSLREKSEKLGVPYTHSHAPGGADCVEFIDRSIDTAGILGARYMVVHPIYHDADHNDISDPGEFISVNIEAYKPWIESAAKKDVIILSENLQYGASADPRNIAELSAKIGSGNFGWCFDTGHAHCSGFSPNVLGECAVAPLSLHIHDNDGNGDDHLIPGDGTIDWDKMISALKKIGYCGDCVLEAHHQCMKAPDDKRGEMLELLLERAKILRAKFICTDGG